MAKEILLTQGQVALVDDEDFERASSIRWRAHLQGRKTKKWYATTTVNKKYLALHRFILDAPTEYHVDHKNGDTLDNTRANLRLVTPAENTYNKRGRGLSGLKGVYLNRHGTWQVTIQHHGVSMHLGNFADRLDAGRAYDAKAKELFGELAWLNFGGQPNAKD